MAASTLRHVSMSSLDGSLGQVVESATAAIKTPGYSSRTSDHAHVNRSGHVFDLDANYIDFSAASLTLLWLHSKTANIRSNYEHATYQWFPKSKLIQSFGLEESGNIAFDHSGNRVYHYFTFGPFWLLPRNTTLEPFVGENSDTVSPLTYPKLSNYTNITENFGGFAIRSAPNTYLNFSLTYKRSGNVNYNPPANVNPFLLDENQVNFTFSFQPLHQLTTDNIYLLDSNRHAHTGAFVYENQVFRTKINYQFTRSISVRVITEYDSTLANSNETSLPRTKQIQTGALLSCTLILEPPSISDTIMIYRTSTTPFARDS